MWKDLEQDIADLFSDSRRVGGVWDGSGMHLASRANIHYQRVLQAVSEQPIVRVRDLAASLDVSSVTVGRALQISGEWRKIDTTYFRRWVNERVLVELVVAGRTSFLASEINTPHPMISRALVGRVLRKHGWVPMRDHKGRRGWEQPCRSES